MQNQPSHAGQRIEMSAHGHCDEQAMVAATVMRTIKVELRIGSQLQISDNLKELQPEDDD